MEGFEDPLNRAGYPWGREDKCLRAHYALLGALRRERTSLQWGAIRFLLAEGPLLAFSREWKDERTVTVVNAGQAERGISLPWPSETATDRLSGRTFDAEDGRLSLVLPPRSGLLLI